MDCETYARDLLVTQEDAIAKIEHEDGEEFVETVRLLRRTTSELRDWLATRQSPIRLIPPLMRRLQIQNHQVRTISLRNYARVLLSLSLGAELTDIPKFIFYGNLPRPVIYVVQELRYIAAHTGRDVLGIVETEERMDRRVKAATTDKILKP